MYSMFRLSLFRWKYVIRTPHFYEMLRDIKLSWLIFEKSERYFFGMNGKKDGFALEITGFSMGF
jgi:hypothetical protein